MNDDRDDLDNVDDLWRNGLTTAAATHASISDPRPRVANRVRRNRRVRVASYATIAGALLVTLAAGTAFALNRSDTTVNRITTEPSSTVPQPSTVVHVNVAPGNQLVLVFPDFPAARTSGEVTLPAGDLRFVFDVQGAGHEIAIDGVPNFAFTAETSGETITRDVHLDPGTYLMHCLIAGHTDAGEAMTLIVS